MHFPIDPCDPDHKSSYVHYLTQLTEFQEDLGIFLVIATVGSCLPQIVKLIKVKSSKGLSYQTLFLANLNQFSVFLSSVVIKERDIFACFQSSLGKCLPDLIVLLQLMGLWLCFLTIFVLYLRYFDRKSSAENYRTYRIARRTFLGFAVVAGSMLIITPIADAKYGPCDPFMSGLYNFLGFFAVSVNLFQWWPQIATTYKLKRAGSLSLLMLVIQAPGSGLVWFYYVFISKEKIALWIGWFTTCLQQLFLLSMIIYYSIKASRKKKAGTLEPEIREDLPLLHPQEEGSVSFGQKSNDRK